ncbi:PKD domain-containing protein [Pedobacter nototheniae]|uniref:PKD domain-containing protein n=1 Tax=Pedobacter nototheniae TaxID=2488994 RepID=UPI00103D34A8|nr:PKD domain-containing protein [Pedobacter nototheniae]
MITFDQASQSMNKRFILFFFLCLFFNHFGNANPVNRYALAVNYHDTFDLTTDGPTSFCVGASVNLSTTESGPYEWFKDGISISGKTNNKLNVVATGTYTVKANGNESNPVTITVNPLPTVSFTSNATGNNCSDEEISFTSIAPDAVSYEWDFGDPSSGLNANKSTDANPKHVFVGTPGNGLQTFIVKLTVRNTNGCVNAFDLNVTTKQLPDANLGGSGKTIYEGLPYFKVCSNNNSSFNFTNLSTTNNASYKIEWGDGSPDYVSNTFTSITHIYQIGINTLTYTVTGLNGCINSIKYFVFVGTNPGVGISNPGNTSICTQEEVTFPITATDSNPIGTKYTVTFSDGSTPVILYHPLIDKFVKHTFLKSSCGELNNSFTASITASNPCGTTPGSTGGIYVSDKPKASFNVSPNKTTCENTILTFTNTSIGNIAMPSGCTSGNLVWSIQAIGSTPANGFSISTGVLGNDFNLIDDPSSWLNGSQTLRINFQASGQYKVSLKIGTNSPTGAACGPDIFSEIICVNPKPVAKFIVDQTEGCGPVNVQTTNNSNQPVCGNNIYQWAVTYANLTGCTNGTSNYSIVSGSLTSATPSFQFINPGVYTLSLVTSNSDNGCVSAKVSKTITIRTLPAATIVAPVSVCAGKAFNVSSTLTNCGSENAPTYLWKFPGSTTASSTIANPTNVIYPIPGPYTITLEVTNECGTTTVTKAINVTESPAIDNISNLIKCTGEATGIINFSTTPANSSVTYAWTNNNIAIGLAGSGNGSSIPSFNVLNTTLTVITATITVTPTLNGCVGVPKTFTITVNPSAPPANANTDQNLCNVTSATLAGNNPGSSFAGKWTQVSAQTGVTFDNDTKYNAIVSGLQAGEVYEFKWTINGISPCLGTSDNVLVTVSPLSVGGTTAGTQSFCGTAAPGDITLSGQVGAVLKWQSSLNGTTWTDIAASAGLSTFHYPAITATTSYRAVVKSGTCGDANSTPTIIIIKPQPAKPTETTSYIYCVGETASVLLATGTDLKWYTSLPLSVSSPTAPTPSTLISGTTTYYVTQTVDGCESPYETIIVKVNPLIANNVISADQNICKNSTPSLLQGATLSGGGGSGTYSYEWQTSADGTNWNATAVASTPTYQPGTLTTDIYYRRIVKSGSCSSISNTVKISVQDALTDYNITADQTICSGSQPNKLIGQVPVGAPTYTWEKSTSSASTGFTIIAGETNPDYQPPSLTQTTYYRRNVFSGPCSMPSSVVTITVNPIPVLVAVQNIIQCNNTAQGTVTFQSTVPSPNITYTWVNDNISIGLAASGTGNLPSFTTQNTSKTPIEANITVTPTYTAGGKTCVGTAINFKITVLPTININPIVDITTCTGSMVNAITLTNDADAFVGSTISYSWTALPAIGLSAGSGTQIPAFTAVNNSATPITATVTVTPQYIYNGKNCTGTPLTYKITINPAPNVTFSGADQIICNNTASADISLSSTTAGVNFAWIAQPVAGITGIILSGTDKIPAQTLINSTNVPLTVTYTAVATTPGTAQCPGSNFVYKITVNPTPIVTPTDLSKTICSATKPNIGFSSNVTGTVFSWTVSLNANVSGATNGSGTLIDQSLTNTSAVAQTITYTVTPKFTNGSSICTGSGVQIIVTVNPSPKIQFSSADATICSGANVAQVNLSSTTIGANINWTAMVPAGISGVSMLNGTTIIPAQTLINSSNTPLTIVYSATASTNDANACAGSVFLYKITVNPVAKITNTPLIQEVCSGSSSSPVILTTNVAATTYKWTASTTSTDLSGFATTGTGNIPAQTIINSGNAKGVVKYVIIPEANGCEGIVSTYEINVNPKPIFTGNANPQAICSNTLFTYTPSSSTLGVTFSWARAAVTGISNPAASGAGIDAAGRIAETLINTTVNPIDVTYVYQLSIGGCTSGTNYNVVVRVNPSPTALFGPFNQNGCAPFVVNIKNLNSKTFANTYTVDYGDGSPVEVYTDERDINHTYDNESALPKNFTLKIKTKNDCGEVASIDYIIVVQPQSVFSKLVLQGNQRYGCAPFTIDFTNLNQSTGANLYTWDFGDGSPIQQTHALNEPLTHAFLIAGDYTIKLTASNGCSTVISTQTITIYPSITAGFTVDKLQYCVSADVQFTNTSDQQFTALWDFGDGTSSSDINPTHTYTTAGNKTVVLKVTKTYPDGSTCTGTITKVVQIIPAPVASFNSNAGNLNCGPFKLTVTSTPANAANVEWDFGDPGGTDNIITGYTASHTYNTPGTYIVTAKAYSLQSCVAIATQIVKVTETPKAEFTYPANLICGPTATILFQNATSYSGTDAVTYKWYVNDVFTSSSKDFTHVFNTPASVLLPYVYKIKLEATNVVGCTTFVEHSVQFNPLPQAAFTFNTVKGCTPFAPQIINTSLFADQFEWYLDGVLVSRDRVPSNIVLNDPDRSYDIKLVANNQWGCTTSTVTKQISTYPNPNALFEVVQDVSCNGILELKVNNKSIGASTYTWDYGDGTPPYTGNNPAHTYGRAGLYELKLTASNGFCASAYTHNIKVADAPKAAFLSSATSGCNQLTVSFQNLSINSSAYLWDFGDGTFSAEKNPVHTYTFAGSPFTVRLVAKGDFDCSDEAVMLNYVQVFAPPLAQIVVSPSKTIKVPEYGFNFSTKTDADIVTYKWEFGDGKTSDKASVEHTYADVGTYNIKLTITNKAGCSNVFTDQVDIIGVPGYLYLPNAFEPANAKPDLKVFKITASGISTYTLKIFNKWGQLIWETDKVDADGVPIEFWDGTMNGQPAPQGAYYWSADAKFINGTQWKGMKYEGKTASKTGVVHLIR